ncbi:hypothetical protein O6V14_04785 [Sphingomonas faeni]|uniref:hypothetical protein n=1 Tax=Sphingomonas faeni TaxID=185950 RepID=UPI0033640F2E
MTDQLQTREQMLAGVTTSEQQAVPVAQSPASIWLSPACEITAHDGRTWANPAPATACDECGDPWVEYVRADLALPCKSGEGATERELGCPCENCGKPVEAGQLILYYDDVGEMHADCENPFSLDYEPPKDDAPEPVILLGSPMVHVPLALVAKDATQTREAEGENGYGCLLEDLHNALHRGEKCPQCGHDPYAALNARGGA